MEDKKLLIYYNSIENLKLCDMTTLESKKYASMKEAEVHLAHREIIIQMRKT